MQNVPVHKITVMTFKKEYLDINFLNYKRLVRHKDVQKLASGIDMLPTGLDYFTPSMKRDLHIAILGRIQKRSELLMGILLGWHYNPNDHAIVNRILLDLGVWTPMKFP